MIVLLCVMVGASTFSIGGFAPLLPEIGRALRLSDVALGALAGTFGFARMAADLPVGLFLRHHLRTGPGSRSRDRHHGHRLSEQRHVAAHAPAGTSLDGSRPRARHGRGPHAPSTRSDQDVASGPRSIASSSRACSAFWGVSPWWAGSRAASRGTAPFSSRARRLLVTLAVLPTLLALHARDPPGVPPPPVRSRSEVRARADPSLARAPGLHHGSDRVLHVLDGRAVPHSPAGKPALRARSVRHRAAAPDRPAVRHHGAHSGRHAGRPTRGRSRAGRGHHRHGRRDHADRLRRADRWSRSAASCWGSRWPAGCCRSACCGGRPLPSGSPGARQLYRMGVDGGIFLGPFLSGLVASRSPGLMPGLLAVVLLTIGLLTAIASRPARRRGRALRRLSRECPTCRCPPRSRAGRP